MIAGAIQIALDFAKVGTISHYFPSNVIEEILAAIGIIIIFTRLPHAIGYEDVYEGDFFSYIPMVWCTIFFYVFNAVNFAHIGAILVTLISLGILIAFNNIQALKKLKVLPQQANQTQNGQWPFATILSRIDSRMSAEMIFD